MLAYPAAQNFLTAKYICVLFVVSLYNPVMKFDGKGFALKIEEQVRTRLRQGFGGRRPKIVSILVGNDPASVLYTRLKQEAAARVGIEFVVERLDRISKEVVAEIASRDDVTGLMLQLPVPDLRGYTLREVLSATPSEKDVDGLRYPESGVVPPVVTAVLIILDEIAVNSKLKIKDSKIVVVGAKGFVGSGVVAELGKRGTQVIGVERGDDMNVIMSGDVVISAVGEEGIIKPEMIREGAVVIDVGAPRGDMTKEVYQKASVSVEVPGGVGPVTIACLMEKGCKHGQ